MVNFVTEFVIFLITTKWNELEENSFRMEEFQNYFLITFHFLAKNFNFMYRFHFRGKYGVWISQVIHANSEPYLPPKNNMVTSFMDNPTCDLCIMAENRVVTRRKARKKVALVILRLQFCVLVTFDWRLTFFQTM